MPDLIAIGYDDTTTAVAGDGRGRAPWPPISSSSPTPSPPSSATRTASSAPSPTSTSSAPARPGACSGACCSASCSSCPSSAWPSARRSAPSAASSPSRTIDKQFQDQVRGAGQAGHLGPVPDRRADDHRQGPRGPLASSAARSSRPRSAPSRRSEIQDALHGDEHLSNRSSLTKRRSRDRGPSGGPAGVGLVGRGRMVRATAGPPRRRRGPGLSRARPSPRSGLIALLHP